jgi:hypothetical protein
VQAKGGGRAVTARLKEDEEYDITRGAVTVPSWKAITEWRERPQFDCDGRRNGVEYALLLIALRR